MTSRQQDLGCGAVLTILALVAAVVGPAGAQGQAPAARTHTVVMANMRFDQLPASIRRGDTIVWVNRDSVPHTATARDRSFDVRVPPRRSARMVVRHAGTIPIYCVFHPAMRATMRVVP